ncbi:MAG: 2-iminoacetate synthase ThiH [Verrucomicrobiota bacterium]|nr:2-iminoacetate synthase ThiH [Verrucomicrobiales bacterium]MEC9080539.1 2-iminoacetate synthase ThiH [Verrucomicrobiota bacterium]
MSFVGYFEQLPIDALCSRARDASAEEASTALAKHDLSLADLAAILSPAAADQIEHLARRAHQLTQQRFGKAIRLFAPLYLSNECINNCSYCGFSRDNPILRVTLSVDEVVREAKALSNQGFRNILLVAGEHPKFVSSGYLTDCVLALRDAVPSISLEVGPMETEKYKELVNAGAEGLVVYQETYDRNIYSEMHTAGPKRNFNLRLETPERAHAAGFRRLGIGALFGLGDWKRETLCLAAHGQYLLRKCWKSQLTISLPRLRPCAGEFEPLTDFNNRALVQTICALRLFLPDVGIVLSTREPANLRDKLIPLGVTMMSAGSHTEPGGYTGAGNDNLHYTKRGRIQEIKEDTSEWSATGQFDIADERDPSAIASTLTRLGYEPVWKDWDTAILTNLTEAVHESNR